MFKVQTVSIKTAMFKVQTVTVLSATKKQQQKDKDSGHELCLASRLAGPPDVGGA